MREWWGSSTRADLIHVHMEVGMVADGVWSIDFQNP